MGKGLSGRKAGATQRGRPHREKPGPTAPRCPQAGQQGHGEWGGGGAGGSCTVFWALYMRLRYSCANCP